MTTTSPRRVLRVKRAFDIVAALLGLAVTAPLLLVVAALVALRLGHPVLFRQQRPGLHGEVFTIVKFRTMLDVDADAGLVTDEQRLTRFGAFLRATSIDELPSLWNILVGDMSLVGPRPSLVRYLDLYTAEESRRHDVRPGLTGLAQVRGRNALPWPERLRSDVEYVDSVSLGLDLRILLRTVVIVLRREGITAPGHVSSDVFTGTDAMDRTMA